MMKPDADKTSDDDSVLDLCIIDQDEHSKRIDSALPFEAEGSRSSVALLVLIF